LPLLQDAGKEVGRPLDAASRRGRPKSPLLQGDGKEVGQPPKAASGGQLELTLAAFSAQNVTASQEGFEVADGLDDRPAQKGKLLVILLSYLQKNKVYKLFKFLDFIENI